MVTINDESCLYSHPTKDTKLKHNLLTNSGLNDMMDVHFRLKEHMQEEIMINVFVNKESSNIF